MGVLLGHETVSAVVPTQHTTKSPAPNNKRMSIHKRKPIAARSIFVLSNHILKYTTFRFISASPWVVFNNPLISHRAACFNSNFSVFSNHTVNKQLLF